MIITETELYKKNCKISDEEINRIARENCFSVQRRGGDLKPHNNDTDDYELEVSIYDLEAMIVKAYKAGYEKGREN